MQETNEVWESNIRAKCQDVLSDYEDSIPRFYSGRQLLGLGQIGFAVGAYLGIVFQHYFFDGLSKIRVPKRCSLKLITQRILRICVMILIVIGHIGVSRRTPRANNIYLRLICQNLMWSMLYMFLVFAFSDLLLLKLRLYDKAEEPKVSEEKTQEQVHLVQPAETSISASV